jgi:peptide/nickel transport system permease protein
MATEEGSVSVGMGNQNLNHEVIKNSGSFLEKNKVINRWASSLWRMAKYLILRVLTILVTLFVGVFVTVTIANQGQPGNPTTFRSAGSNGVFDYVLTMSGSGSGAIDAAMLQEAFSQAYREMPVFSKLERMTPEQIQSRWAKLSAKYDAKSGINLPWLPRNLLWTWRALRFDLGMSLLWIRAAFYQTRMLVEPAFLLIFLLGIPLSLYLFRHHGSWLDRLFTFLAPISSIPSWVLGMFLVLIFAVGLHILPPSGMKTPGYEGWFWPDMIKHLILPVLAIFLSLFFQLLYTWKTFFLTYSNEDYVELGRAKGLPNRVLERKYILRPSLNYILTNFALMLVTFWQLTIVLEHIFDWPGIGEWFVTSLPNLATYAKTEGGGVNPGNILFVVSIVVFFAYLMGAIMLVLDVVYALVDPRFRIGSESQTVQGKVAKGWTISRRARNRDEAFYRQRLKETPYRSESIKTKQKVSFSKRLKSFGAAFHFLKPFLQELRRYPSAVLGLVIILLMIIGSIVAVTAFPYYRIGSLWYETELTGKVYIPRIAKPVWINWFLKDPLPPSLFLDSNKGQVQETIDPNTKGGVEHTILIYPIPFQYGGFPTDLTFYFSSRYVTKRPFISLTWLTPDGRKLVLDNLAPNSTAFIYSFARDLQAEKLLQGFPNWKNWFSLETFNTTPSFELMFADPAAKKAKTLEGNYTLQIDVYTFEPNSSVDAQLALLGQVWGPAGTDYLRRNLIVPLLWGMPFALALGLGGASLTTFLSMILATTGVFFGGWLDQAIQRIIEGVMILPVIAIGVILFVYSNVSIWVFLAGIALLNVFGSPTKSFRAALIQIKDAPYIEWARTSGASNGHIIWNYLLPNILPLVVPQLVALIPTYVFLEATLGIFGVKSPYPTWGRIIYDALQNRALFGSSYWVFEPIFFLLLTGLAFSMLGFALEKILNPRLRNA